MPSLKLIRDGLKANLQTITDLRAHDTVPDQINPPAAIVGGPQTIEFDLSFARGADRWLIPVRVYVGRVSDRSAQDKVDDYLASSGATSIKQAIESDKDLGNAADSVRVLRAQNYGVYEISDIQYLGVEFIVEVIA